MRRASAAAAALALCCLGSVLSACSGDDGDPTSTSSAPPSSGSPSDPTSTSGTPSGDPEDPPVLPEAAKHKTAAGGKAFVRYYAEVLNYSVAVQSTARLRSLATGSCVICEHIADALDKAARRGGLQRGGEWTVELIFLVPGQREAAPKLVAKVRISPGVWRPSSNSSPKKIKAQTLSNEFDLLWRSRWLIKDVIEA